MINEVVDEIFDGPVVVRPKKKPVKKTHPYLDAMLAKYSADQPRDKDGKWTVVGGAGYRKRNPDDRTDKFWSEMSHEEKRDWDHVFRAWDDITRDDPYQEDPQRAFPERYVDRREARPAAMAGLVLRHGQVETHLRRSVDGGAELYDMTPLTPGMTVDSVPKGLKLDLSGDGEGGQPLVEVAGSARPPKYAYRIVAAPEWDQALTRGFFQSDGRMNLGADEGTVMSSVSTGSFYLPKTGQARIIRFHHDPAWKLDPNDSYIKTQDRISLDRVDRVSGLIDTQYLGIPNED